MANIDTDMEIEQMLKFVMDICFECINIKLISPLNAVTNRDALRLLFLLFLEKEAEVTYNGLLSANKARTIHQFVDLFRIFEQIANIPTSPLEVKTFPPAKTFTNMPQMPLLNSTASLNRLPICIL